MCPPNRLPCPLAEESGAFTIDDVIQTVTESKDAIHMFSATARRPMPAVLANWEP